MIETNYFISVPEKEAADMVGGDDPIDIYLMFLLVPFLKCLVWVRSQTGSFGKDLLR